MWGFWEEHLEHLGIMFSRMAEENLTIKFKKCQYGNSTCPFLGHDVGQGTIKPLEAKVQAILDFPLPTKKKGVLGLSGYHRRFIPNYTSEMAALT